MHFIPERSGTTSQRFNVAGRMPAPHPGASHPRGSRRDLSVAIFLAFSDSLSMVEAVGLGVPSVFQTSGPAHPTELEMNFLRQFQVMIPFLAFTGAARAQLIVNSPEPITKSFLVQVVDTAADDGTTPAPLFGAPSQQAAIFSAVNTIWAQAGIQVQFEFLSGTWNNSFALMGTAGNNSPRPSGDLSTIVGDAFNDSALKLDSNANQLYMLQIVPTFSQAGSSTVNGFSFTGLDGMTLFVGSSLPTTTAGQDVAGSILAHEIGRNLGLPTDTTDNQDLMNPGGSGGELLTSSQITAARDSQFLTSVPEPSVAGLLAAGVLLLIRRRRGLRAGE